MNPEARSKSTITEELGETLGYLEVYVQRKIQLAKLDTVERVAKTTASLATLAVLLSVVPIFLGLFSFGLGYYLSEALGWSLAQSFFVLSGGYLLLGGLLYLFRRRLFTNPIIGVLIREFFK